MGGGGGVMCVCYWFRVGCLYFLLPSLPFPLIFFYFPFPFPRFFFFSCFFIYSYLCLGEWCAPESEEEFPG